MEKREVLFHIEKETKNTIRYEEKPAEVMPPAVGTIYIQKWAVGNPPPKVLRVTIEEAG